MGTMIELHESILGEFAHQEDARAVGQALQARGWPVTYSDEGTPRWQFESLADYRRFERDFEAVRDELSSAGGLHIRWGCNCDERQEEPCPHGVEQQHDEMTPARVQRQVEEAYPGFAQKVEALTQSLYNAVWFGSVFEALTGEASASGLFLRSDKWRRTAETDVARLDVAASLFDFAEHDAAFEAVWSGAGHELADLENLPRCETCGDWADFGCRCEEE